MLNEFLFNIYILKSETPQVDAKAATKFGHAPALARYAIG
jgi:hypothetical protein